MVKNLLKTRQQIKKSKPTFRRQQVNQFAKFKNDDAWRRPKGLQSKMRLKRRGHRKMPTVGFKSPKLVSGLNRDGLSEVVVHNIVDLKLVNAKIQVPVIGKTVGGKKRLEILAEGKKLGLKFANVMDIDEKIKQLTKKPKVKKTKETKKTSDSKKEDSKIKKTEVKSITKSAKKSKQEAEKWILENKKI